MMLSRHALLAIAAVVDVALHARPVPVAARALAERLNLPPRHLETLLQALVRANILKGVRGPRGGYELARERRRVSAGDIVRAVMEEEAADPGKARPRLVQEVVMPLVATAATTFLDALDAICIDDLCRKANETAAAANALGNDFTI